MNQLAEKISDAELSIMQVLWDAEEGLSMTELRRRVQQRTTWGSTTVKTLVQRLTAKGVLRQEKREVFYYIPLIPEAEYNASANKSFINRVYRGSARDLVAALLRSNDLSDEDVSELRELFHVEGADE